MNRVIAFRKKLIVLMHMTSRQPAPEILSVLHSNTVKGGHGNVFIEDGMVVFATCYYKEYAVKGDGLWGGRQMIATASLTAANCKPAGSELHAILLLPIS